MNSNSTLAAQYLWLVSTVQAWLERGSDPDRERGSHTGDVLGWAIAIVAICGIAVAAVTTYVNGLAADLLGS